MKAPVFVQLLFLGLTSLALLATPAGAQPPPPTPDQGAAQGAPMPAGVDVLTRGPLHEAFAQPVNLSGAATPVIPKRPPNPITENPADYRPDSEGSVWIPGYWSWDDQKQDFTWVSGVWRVPPPNMQWIAGYWVEANPGFQWVPGCWLAADVQQMQYYPQPPAPPDENASGEATSSDDFWSPGHWDWQNGQFAWSAGYWTAARAGWVWTPTYYSFTPRGFARVDGYWDYDLAHRGLAFAPLSVTPAAYQAGFAYTPSVAIDPNVLTFYLFARPAYCQYYFGDYFAADYEQTGIYPWYAIGRYRGYHYDPLFAYDRWYYRSRDPQWVQNLDYWDRYYRGHPEARPPHDLAAERRLAAQHPDRPDFRMQMIGQPLSNLVRSPALPYHLTQLNAAERSKAVEGARANRAFESQRSRLEASNRARPGMRGLSAPEKAALPHQEHAIVGPRYTPGAALGENRPAIQPGPTHRETMRPVVPNQRETPQSHPNEIRPNEHRPQEIRPAPARPTEIKPKEIRPAPVRPNEARPKESRPNEFRPNEGQRRAPEPQAHREGSRPPAERAAVEPQQRHPRAPNFPPAHAEAPRQPQHPAPAPAKRPEPEKKDRK